MAKGKTEISNAIIRRERVRELILNGARRVRTIEIITSEFNVGVSCVENDLTIVYKDLREYAQQHAIEMIADHLGKYDQIFAKSNEMFDFKSCLRALRQKEDLMKLHKVEPLVVNNNSTTVKLDNVSDEVLLQALTKLNEPK